MSAQTLEAEASDHVLGRQVFWLMAHHGPRTAFPRLPLGGVWPQWRNQFEGLANYSGGPATDLHRFPFYPAGFQPAENLSNLSLS